MKVYLDTGILGLITHPNASEEAKACIAWVVSLLKRDIDVFVPEICDYELRREYIRRSGSKALGKLDDLKTHLNYKPITTGIMQKAAELWAKARNVGHKTASDQSIDGDVILAAIATDGEEGEMDETKLVIATTNVAHLAFFAPSKLWTEIS